MEDKADENGISVVTIRCRDSDFVEGNSDKIVCAECGEMTYISPSWRGKNVDRVICHRCFDSKYRDTKFDADVTEECLNNAIDYVIERFNPDMSRDDIKKKMIKMLEERCKKNINVVKDT